MSYFGKFRGDVKRANRYLRSELAVAIKRALYFHHGYIGND